MRELAPIARTGTLDTDPAHGNLTINAGAKLTAKGGAIAIDSTGTPLMAGLTESDTVAIGARQIALGAVPQGSTALALGNAQLAALGSARNFVLRSYSSIDLYGTSVSARPARAVSRSTALAWSAMTSTAAQRSRWPCPPARSRWKT